MCCSLNSVDPAICLGSQDMCFLIREPGFTSHTLTLSRKLQLQCLLCFAYQKPRLFQFPLCSPPCPSAFGNLRVLLWHTWAGDAPGGCAEPLAAAVEVPTFGAVFGVKNSLIFHVQKAPLPFFIHELGWWPQSHQAADAEHHQVLSTPPDLKFPVTSGFFPLAVGLNCVLAGLGQVLLPQPCWALLCWELQPVPAEQSHKLLTLPSYSNLLTTAL